MPKLPGVNHLRAIKALEKLASILIGKANTSSCQKDRSALLYHAPIPWMLTPWRRSFAIPASQSNTSKNCSDTESENFLIFLSGSDPTAHPGFVLQIRLAEFGGEISLLAKDHAVMKNQDEWDDKKQRNPVVKKKAERDLQ